MTLRLQANRFQANGWFIDEVSACSLSLAPVYRPGITPGSILGIFFLIVGKPRMSKLDEAVKRLDGAADGLEASLAAALARDESSEMVLAELEVAKRDHAALAATTDEVSVKLDTVIGRLKFVLDA